jgi:aryl-alcohol dehydrogenase-like predicted oxidoreductase
MAALDMPLMIGLFVCVRLQCNSTPDALALACVLKQPFEPMILSGAATQEQLQQNYAALQLAQELPCEVLQQLQDELSQPVYQYWEDRAKLAWN